MRKLELVRVKIQEVISGAIKKFVAAGYAGHTLKGELLQQYGFTSRPRTGTEGVALQVSNGSFLICTGDKEYFVEVGIGEVCMHASPAVKIHLKVDDSIEITGSAIVCNIAGDVAASIAGNVTANVGGDVTTSIQGNMTATVDGASKLVCSDVEIGEATLQAVIQSERFKAYFDTHYHTGNLGAPTSPPVVPLPQSVMSTEVKTGG